MAFDPKQHMTNLKGKDYLETKWRIVWFKDENPQGSIQTEIVNYQPLVVRAVIYNNDGVLVATGHGSANAGGKSVVWAGREIEKAETAAIGRALGHSGYGSQFDPDSDEGEYLADSPIERIGGKPQNGSKTRQDAPNFDAAQNNVKTDVEPQNAATAAKSALAGNGAPANGEKKIIGRWSFDRNALLTAIAPISGGISYQERGATIKKMDEEKAFANCADIDEAVQLVLARLAMHRQKEA